jgi:hypothetical protein
MATASAGHRLSAMRRGSQQRVTPQTRVMRRGKTQRDRHTGAWLNHKQNKEWRRLQDKATPHHVA